MKSRTLFFNPAVFRKDITRFAPLWGLYLVGMILLCVGGFFRTESDFDLASVMGTTIGVFSIFNFGYALICAELLFGDLFNARLCNALHAMPLRRESWFFTHTISGILFSLIPNLIVGLLLIPQLGHYWFVSFIWVGGLTLGYLFFFGAAVLSAMCTGSRFSMVVVYGLINFLSILIFGFLKGLYEPLMYGIHILIDEFLYFSPVSYLCSTELNFLNSLDKIAAALNPNNGWPYLVIISVVGVAMLIVALLAYRKRQLECAGDFITVRSMKPIFHVLYTLAAGIVLHLSQQVFGIYDGYVFLIVGIVIGFLTGQMLLKRSLKVFTRPTFIGLAAVAVLLFGTMGLAKLDVLGIASYIPQVQSVATLSIGNSYDAPPYTTSDATEIEDLLTAHQLMLNNEEEDLNAPYPFDLRYTLTDGRTISRRYLIDYNNADADIVCKYLSKPEHVLQTDDVQALLQDVQFVEIAIPTSAASDSFLFFNEDADSFLQAVLADCEAGTMAQTWYAHEEDMHLGWVQLSLPNTYPYDCTFEIWSSAENCVAWMQEHNLYPN